MLRLVLYIYIFMYVCDVIMLGPNVEWCQFYFLHWRSFNFATHSEITRLVRCCLTIVKMVRNVFKCVSNWMLYDPRRIVRIIVLIVCVAVVVFQVRYFIFPIFSNVFPSSATCYIKLCECVRKLRHPPISTHTQFDINDTMTYPAVTFCRNPPYKADILAVNYYWIYFQNELSIN